MKRLVIPLVFLGFVSVIALTAFKGGNSVTIQEKDAIVRIALPAIDTQVSNKSETATFALG